MTTTNLYTKLKQAKTEEDVKDIYIKALNLKSYNKGVFNVDLSTEEIWFEAKNNSKHSFYKMFTQLLAYVQDALNKGETVPPLLAVIDTEKAALMKTEDVLPFLEKKTIKWGQSASRVTPEALTEVSAHIGAYFVSFYLEAHEDEFINIVREAIESREIIGRQITPYNLKQVFDKWVAMIGRNLVGAEEKDYNALFFADIMHDGKCATHDNLTARLLQDCYKPVFALQGQLYELNQQKTYREFWRIYVKPPKQEYRDKLLERRDTLIPINERSFKGAFYTPLNVVDKAYDKLSEILGESWQEDYIIWDMCCGVGNLEVKHSNPRNIYMSTLDQADIDVMKSTKTCSSAYRFQYDYLNDDISDNGKIDYSLTNKIPESLRKAIAEGKKILVLINPPYVEAGNRGNIAVDEDDTDTKGGVSKTKVSKIMTAYGKASNELFAQFVARIAQEIPNATLAMFSTMKYVNAPNFEKFRQAWNAQYLGGFVVHNQAFDGMSGEFPIGFLCWKTNENIKNTISEVRVDVFDKRVQPMGEKLFYNLPSSSFLNVFAVRPRANKELVLPLKNAISPSTASPRVKTWADNAIGYMHCDVNDLQHAEQGTTIYSSVFGGGNGFYLTPENLWQSAVVFSVRCLVKPTWLNDRDQFLQPTKELNDEFKNDCLVMMLFNRKNRAASANDLEWNGKKWAIVNHFIPFTENEVNANGRFESDFMVCYLKNKQISKEAIAVLDAGRELWKAYFSQTDDYKTQEELKLNRPDVGWYQIRNALKKRIETPVDFADFETAYKILSDKLQPQVFELGFLRA